MLRETFRNLALRCGSALAIVGQVSEPKRFVYVLESNVLDAASSHGAHYYVGPSADVPRRVDAHNAGLSSHTSRYGAWRTHVVIEFADEATAVRFERYLKSGSGRAFAKRHFG
jgi:putative endonuclease